MKDKVYLLINTNYSHVIFKKNCYYAKYNTNFCNSLIKK